MHNMAVPEKIIGVFNSMYPVMSEIQYNESNDICQNRRIDLRQSNTPLYPCIRYDCNAQPQYIFGNHCKTRSQAADCIQVVDFFLFKIPAIKFLNEYE